MNYKIVEFESTKVVGMVYTGKNQNSELVDLWKAFMERYQQIEQIASKIMYGLCYDYVSDGTF